MSVEAEGEDPRFSKLAAAGTKASGKREPSSSQALTRFLEEAPAEPPSGFVIRPSQGMIAAAVALILGGAFIGGAQFLGGKTQPSIAVAQVDPNAPTLRKLEDEIHTLKVSLDAVRATSENSRQDEAIRSVRKNVELLKQDIEVAKVGTASAVTQLNGKIDKLDRDPTPRLAEISARLDKLDRNDKDPNPKLAEITQRLDQLKADTGGRDKLADITARLDRIERSISSPVPTGTIRAAAKPAPVPAPAPAPSAAADNKPAAAKVATIDGWLLRDVYDGVALVEGRGGGLREVSPGQFIPGAGEIRSIEKRGRSWVVVTSRGIIVADNRW